MIVLGFLVGAVCFHFVMWLLARRCWLHDEALQRFTLSCTPWLEAVGVPNPRVRRQTIYGFCCRGYRMVEFASWEVKVGFLGRREGSFSGPGPYLVCPKCGRHKFSGAF